MRIVTNALALVPGGSGVQTYERELLGALPAVLPRGIALEALVQRRAVPLLRPGVVPRVRPDADGAARTALGVLPVRDADLVHGLDAELPVATGAAATVATVHDLAVFDVPWAFSRRRAVVRRATTRWAIRRADAVVVPSAFTAERVRARFARDCTVVHEAPAAGFAPAAPEALAAFRVRRSLPAAFVAHVGNVEPRKDLTTLAAACRDAGLPLVLAGGHLRATAPPPGTIDLGHLDRADLPLLYGAATVVAYVSRYEGFGLPPIEALACGAIVLATRVGALPELVPDAVEFVPAGDAAAQAAALARLAGDADLRAERRRVGLDAVARLSWEATARRTAAVYASLGAT